jgi:hypothetical protein
MKVNYIAAAIALGVIVASGTVLAVTKHLDVASGVTAFIVATFTALLPILSQGTSSNASK